MPLNRLLPIGVLLSVMVVPFLAPPVTVHATTLAESTFDTSADGWSFINDGTNLRFNPTGGNPGGFISVDDLSLGPRWRWSAPGKFLGNKATASLGTLSFDLSQTPGPGTTQNLTSPLDVLITNGPTTLFFDTPGSPGVYPSWTPFQVPFDAAAGWRQLIANTLGPNATQAQLSAVLSSLTGLFISGEYTVGADTGHLDNVRLRDPKQQSFESFQQLVTVFKPFQPLVPITLEQLTVNRDAIDSALARARNVPAPISSVNITLEDDLRLIGYLMCVQTFGFACVGVAVEAIAPELGDTVSATMCLVFSQELACLRVIVKAAKTILAQVKEFLVNPRFRVFTFDVSIEVPQDVFDQFHLGDRIPSDTGFLGSGQTFSIVDVVGLTDTANGGMIRFHVEGLNVAAVPEPSSIFLLACGLMSLGAFAWRRRRRRRGHTRIQA